jgi:hypothetical protein
VRRSDLRLKLLSFGLAAALLVVVRGERRSALILSVPLEARLPAGLEPAAPLPSQLRVAIAGPWARLRALDEGDLGRVTIDLSQTGPGVASWYVRPESLHLPSGVQVESVYPSQGTVVLGRDRP